VEERTPRSGLAGLESRGATRDGGDGGRGADGDRPIERSFPAISAAARASKRETSCAS
jgi:hypothetical protein